MSTLPPNTIRLWKSDTPTDHDLYPAVVEPIARTQTATWGVRVVTGPTSADAETLISSWVQDDYSGGIGIKDANESVDTSRIAFGVIDGRHPRAMCLPPETRAIASGWNPSNLGATLLAWYKADAITGKTDGNALSQWDDSSGNARHLVQATGGAQPTYQTGELNGLPVVQFDGTDDRLEIASDFGLGTNITIAAVWKAAAGSGLSQFLVEVDGGASTPVFGTDSSDFLATSVAGGPITTVMPLGNWHVTILSLDSSGNVSQSFDGGTHTTGGTAPPVTSNTHSTVGSDLAETGSFLNGQIAELMVLNAGSLSATNEGLLFKYLADKWGLTDSLPEDYGSGGFSLGAFWPLGDVGTQFYGGWASLGIYGWNDTLGFWHTTANAWPASFTPVGEAVPFGGYLFVPGGANGTMILSEATAATGTLTVDSVAVNALALGLHDGKLWAIDTDNHLFSLTAAKVLVDPGDIANWAEMTDAFGNPLILDPGLTPTALLNYFNVAGAETLWAITRGQGAYLFNPDEPRWIKSTVREGAHNDWGLAAEVFRDGEDLWIAGGGLDVTRFTTANVEVPLSGPSKDQGVPPAYQGTIVDLCSERSTLYALVAAGASVPAGSPTSQWVLQQTVGNAGSGTGQFQSPGQVATDASGNVYVADTGNNRLQKFTSAGVYSTSITGLTAVSGVAVDSSGNVYVAFKNAASDYRLRKYNSSLAVQWTSALLTTGGLGHVATDGTNVYVTYPVANAVGARLCSTGASVWFVSGTGTGNGQYHAPSGIAVSGSSVYVADTGNNRIQKLTTAAGAYSAQWGSSGSGNGQFSSPVGLAFDGSTRLWVCDQGNNRLQRFSTTGTYQTKIAQSSPAGIGVASGDILWVSSLTNTLAEWDEETVATAAIPGKAWLGAWTGTAWCALWESAQDMAPTWMRVALSTPYALWWGDDNGVAYRQLLPEPFLNPAARVTLGGFPFAKSGWMETVRYDANLSGWDKIASHLFAMLDYAAPDVYVDISYRTDADQWHSGELDPPYRPWKRIDHAGRSLCWFDDATVDDRSGLPRRMGEVFQWIQFYYAFYRGDDREKSPLWMWHSMHHVPVPQDSASFVLKIPTDYERGVYRRSPEEMELSLRQLQTAREFPWLQIGNPRPHNPEYQVFFRGKVTQIKSEFTPGANNNLARLILVNFVEIGASSNEHTTLAADMPS